jgi:hypothetical protein
MSLPVGRMVRLRGALTLAGALALTLFAGCSSAQPSPDTESGRAAISNFDLSKCQVLEPSLYRCPGTDKALCDPDFARNDVQCVKITKTGVLLQQISP